MIMEMKIDKKNGTCLYNDEKHVYWDEIDKSKYISVTTLIGQFQQPFDEYFWSSYKALEKIHPDFSSIKIGLIKSKRFTLDLLEGFGIKEDDFNEARNTILAEWAEKNKTACDRGTLIHLNKELEFYKNKEHSIPQYKIGGTFKCERDYYELDMERAIYPEYLVSHKIEDGKNSIQIAGQIDLFVKDGNDIYILDYKTNKKLDFKSYYNRITKKFDSMKYPLNNVMDCNVMHYTLQLSTYAYLLKLINPEFNVKQLKIIHFDHDGNESHYELDYMEEEVKKMIKFYQKESMLASNRAKRKEIEY